MSKKNTAPRTDVPKVETLQEMEDRLIQENGEDAFRRWKESAPETAAEMAAEVAEKALRPFGTSALAGLRAGGSFVAALKGADAKAAGRAAARLDLARQKTIARKGALLRADVPESALSAAKAAEAFLFDLGMEVAKRSDIY